MQLIKKIKLFLVSFFIAGFAYASDKQCYENSILFFHTYKKLDATGSEIAHMLEPTCVYLEKQKHYDGVSPLLYGFAALGDFAMEVLAGSPLSAFEDMSGSVAQIEYKRQLMLLANIDNPVDRVRAVYELSLGAQGRYSREHADHFLSPSSVIDKADKEGSGGICRQFSTLLHWSLKQLARHPESSGYALGPMDYNSDIMMSHALKHMWVRVNIPKFNKEGRLTNHVYFDLDPATITDRFSMIVPLRTNLSIRFRQRLHGQCRRIQNCLRNKN